MHSRLLHDAPFFVFDFCQVPTDVNLRHCLGALQECVALRLALSLQLPPGHLV